MHNEERILAKLPPLRLEGKVIGIGNLCTMQLLQENALIWSPYRDKLRPHCLSRVSRNIFPLPVGPWAALITAERIHTDYASVKQEVFPPQCNHSQFLTLCFSNQHFVCTSVLFFNGAGIKHLNLPEQATKAEANSNRKETRCHPNEEKSLWLHLPGSECGE